MNSAALASGTLTALILPPVLVRSLDTAEYSVWMLCLQTVTLVSLFELGVGITATRLIGQRAQGNQLPESAWAIARAAVRIHLVVASVAALLIIAAALALPTVFPGIPGSAVHEARFTWLAMGVVAVAQIPVQSLLAPRAAAQRAYPVVLVSAAASLLASATVIVAAWRTGSLAVMAAFWAVANLVGVAYAVRLTRSEWPSSNGPVSRAASPVGLVFRETRWQSLILLLAFLVGGLDVAIVGRFAFEEVASFAVAASIVIRLAAVVHALQAPMLAEYAREVGRGRADRLALAVTRHARLGTLAVVLIFGAVSAVSPALMPVWLGPELGESAAIYLMWLALGTGLRLVAIPIAILATAAGEQRITVVAGALETAVNLTLSLILVQVMGPVGVAVGTIAGGCVSLASHLSLTIPRVRIVLRLREIVLRAAARSALPFAVLAASAMWAARTEDFATQVALGVVAVVTAAGGSLVITCTASDRAMAASIVRKCMPLRGIRR